MREIDVWYTLYFLLNLLGLWIFLQHEKCVKTTHITSLILQCSSFQLYKWISKFKLSSIFCRFWMCKLIYLFKFMYFSCMIFPCWTIYKWKDNGWIIHTDWQETVPPFVTCLLNSPNTSPLIRENNIKNIISIKLDVLVNCFVFFQLLWYYGQSFQITTMH